jgi:hypothetical protein
MGLSLPIPVLEPPPPPIGEILSPESEPILEYHAELQSAARNLRYSLAKIAYYGWKMRLSDGWVRLGFESGPRGEDAYRESLDIPRSTYFKHVRIGQSLHQLSLEDLTRIPTTNAELLIQVDPAIWHERNWVSDAKTLKPKALGELVAERNKAVGSREPLSTMVVKVPFLAKQAMEAMLESVQHKYELSSKGQALELMIADLHQDANLVSAADRALQLLRGVQESMKRRQAPESDETRWLEMAMEVLNEGYEKAVQAAREKSNRGKAHGGRA